MKREYIYKGFGRFWHWSQSILTVFLGVTGFEIHGFYTFFGFEQAVRYHSTAAVALVVLIAFTIFWHFTTGEWRQYLPTRQHLKAQMEYYLTGIFRDAPHPTKKTVHRKLNPLQKIVYFSLKILVIPVMVISGLLYMFFRYPHRHGFDIFNIHGLENIALFHTAGAFFLVAFVIANMYLITTGHTATSNLKAMITGYDELEEDSHPQEPPAKNSSTEAIAEPS
jgi:thiosulfate reductase cytochrome b subunit